MSIEQANHPTLPEHHKLALFDIDGTLIDHNYQATDTAIYEVVERAKEQDWQLGLSSDTGYEAMKQWHRHFGFNGPIIAERGAQVVLHTDQDISNSQNSEFAALKQASIEYFSDTNIRIWQGNPVQLLLGNITVSQAFKPGETVVLINDGRRHTFNCFARIVDESGKLKIDDQTTESVAAAVRSLYPEGSRYDEDLSHEHGLLITSPEGTHKRAGSLLLREELGITRFAMIGNSFADYVGHDIAVHLAVGSSTAEFKEVAHYVAPGHVTEGAAQALEHLISPGEGNQ